MSAKPDRFSLHRPPMEASATAVLGAVLTLPVLIGLAGAVLPAFGYLPALGGTQFSLQPFRDLLAVPGLWSSAALSLSCGVATTLVAVVAVLLFVAGFSGTTAFRRARQALGPLMAVPHAAAALGLVLLVAPSGMFVRLVAMPLGLDTPPDFPVPGDRLGLAMMAGLVVKELPFLLLVTFAALPQADPERRLRLARTLGYGRMSGFTLAVWPAVYRQIRLPVLAVAAYSASVVDVAVILGPSTPAPLAVRLVGWMGDPDLSLRFMASAGALLQCGVTACVLGLWLGLERLGALVCRSAASRGVRLQADGTLRVLALAPVLLAGALTLFGLAALALWSFAGPWGFPALLPKTLTTRAWGSAFPSADGPGAGGPIATTVLVAGASAGLALLLIVWMLETRRRASGRSRADAPAPVSHPNPAVQALPETVTGLLYLPLIVPQVAFVFGLQWLVLVSGLAPSLALLVAVHLVFVLPYVALALASPWAALDPRYERMAASLGRARWTIFARIRLPMLLAPLATAFAIGFAVSAGQYLPTLLIGAGRLPTITTEAVALASGGDRRLIGVYALLQTALPCLVLAGATLLPALLHRERRGMRG